MTSPTASGAPHAIALGLAVTLAAVAHLLLKTGARDGYARRRGPFNAHTLAGCALLSCVAFLFVYAMQAIELKTVTAWTSVTYVLVLALSRWVLGERLNGRRLVGCVLVLVGILLFSLPSRL
jgi:drug/metabolite transporter (DMT)-like permease